MKYPNWKWVKELDRRVRDFLRATYPDCSDNVEVSLWRHAPEHKLHPEVTVTIIGPPPLYSCETVIIPLSTSVQDAITCIRVRMEGSQKEWNALGTALEGGD